MKTLMQIDDLLLQALVEGDAFEPVKLTALMEFQNRETKNSRRWSNNTNRSPIVRHRARRKRTWRMSSHLPQVRSELMHAQDLIRTGDCGEARKILVQLTLKKPSVPCRVQLRSRR